MKLKISLNTILLGLFIIVAAIFFIKNKSAAIPQEKKPEISNASASRSNDLIREIKVTAKRFSFSPNPVRLKLNEPVRFRITSQDVAHGFSIPELGIDEIINPGKEAGFEFTPTKKGTYTILCSISCGIGHSGMRSKIIVE